MSLWLNKKEQLYLSEVIRLQIKSTPEGDGILTAEQRAKLLDKIESVKT